MTPARPAPPDTSRAAAFLQAFEEDRGTPIAFWWVFAGPSNTLTLPEQIAASVGDRIISHAIAPGEWIREQEIGQQFGVSRSPVREAMRLLEREGVVRIHARRGARATFLAQKEIQDLFEVRASLVRLVGRRAAEHRPGRLLELLEIGFGTLGETADDPAAARRYGETAAQMTLLCAALCGNDRLFPLIASLSMQMLRYTSLGLKSRERRRRSIVLWRGAIDAIRRGDADAAEQFFASRLEENWREIRRLLETEVIA